ncbi:recombinase family protein [Patescibacteria group bacterium]|nr:recombinase family protein [Patescibacteria group bacterium]
MFQQVIEAIDAGKANALIAYDASRLARNALEGARIIDLLDSGKLRLIVTATSAFRNTSTDKFMLAFFFAQSKHYVDNLSEVVIRGMRSKANKGIFPGRAKIGYLNHPRTHEIVPDPEMFPLIKKAFELYASNRWGLADMSDLTFELGLKNESGKKLAKSQIARLLTDPIYYGAFI